MVLLAVILSATFLYGFDLNVVNVALPSLAGELHAGGAALQLVVGGYTFSYAAGLVTGGRLGDRYGHRRLFLAGMAAFAVASALCALAPGAAALVAARLVQGLAAAAMVPQVLALITTTYPADRRPRALAGYGLVAAVSGICGQLLGGLLLSADPYGLGWRTIFWVNVPVAAAVLAVAPRVLPRTAPAADRRGDLGGAFAVAGTLGLALVPLILGRQFGWPFWCWLLLAAAVPVGALTVRIERRAARPVLDLGLFANRPYRAGVAIAALFMASFTAVVFAVSLLLQDGIGLTPFGAGLVFGPMALCGVVAPLFGRRLLARVGAARTVLVGCLADMAGFLALAVVLALRGSAITAGWLVVPLAVAGLGNTILLPALLGATLAAVRREAAGVAAGTLTMIQQFGGVAGLAVLGTAYFALLGAHPGRGGYAGAVAVLAVLAAALTAVMAALSPTLHPTGTPAATAPRLSTVDR